MVGPVSVALIVALAGLLFSLAWRRRARRGSLGLDDWCLVLGLHLGSVGALAIGLAWADVFSPISLALGCGLGALAGWPWRVTRLCAPAERPRDLAQVLILLVVIAIGVGLRAPSIPAPLAGRDQGTYVLRARATLRTGSLGWRDEVLANAGADRVADPEAAGPHDLLGLYPRNRDPWREGVYEAAYRPGVYLADRDRGRVTPQFFHFHPMTLGVAGAAFGIERMGWAMLWLAGIGLLAFGCCARRLLPGHWPVVAVALLAASPLAIWTARTPLSEGAMLVFEWTAVLAALRMRDEVEREPWFVGAMLACAALVRGNALITLPVVAALLWLRHPGEDAEEDRRSTVAASLVVFGMLASVVVHATTTYPYLHDELLRRRPDAQLESAALGPAALIGLTAAGVVGWLAIDRAAARLPRPGWVRRWLPTALAAGVVGAFAWWWSLRAGAEGPRPFSRLDAAPILIGLPWLLAAGAGLAVVVGRWRPRTVDVWLLALAAVVPTTALLYAPRELPTLAFFYYGRYLVPELLPCAALLAAGAFAQLPRGVERWFGRGFGRGFGRWFGRSGTSGARWLGVALGSAASVALIAQVGRPLVEHPQVRLLEYHPAGDAVDWLAERIEPGAVVIAGGEGWHHDHTFNQVGGALAMGHGVEVVPYRSREAAWVTAWELLVARPRRTGEPAPPVYLLVNEAAHPVSVDGRRLALLDDQLWAPFALERVGLVELFVHALTPVADAIPTRVARHELRMGLMKLRVDEDALAAIARVEVDDAATCTEGAMWLELPAGQAERHLVVVGRRPAQRWRLTLDGEPVGTEPPRGLPRYERATLGPFAIDGRARTLEVRDGGGGCPAIAELRLLPRERGGLDRLPPSAVEAISITPADDLGHPPTPIVWVQGRAASRYRPGTTPGSEVHGRSLVVRAERGLVFAPMDLPTTATAFSVVVTLTRAEVDPGTTLHVLVDEVAIAQLEIPEALARTWIAPPISWTPDAARAEVRVELVGASPGQTVELRDVALFAAGGELEVVGALHRR